MTYSTRSLAALLGICAAACRQADVTPIAAPSLLGEWHWTTTAGGIGGTQTYTPASTGTTETWVFKADSTYQHVTAQAGGPSGTDTGTFSLGSRTDIRTLRPARLLVLRGLHTQSFLLDELTTRLTLFDNHYDGFTYTYAR